MHFIDLPARPHNYIANDDFHNGVRVGYNALRIYGRGCLPRLITAQQFSAPAIELREKYPDLPRYCRHAHTRLTGLLYSRGLELVRPKPARLSRGAVEAIGSCLDHPHHSKASRRSRHKSSHQENSYVSKYPAQHQQRQMGSPCRLRNRVIV